MAESVDALVSNTSGATHPGSIPGLGTKKRRETSPFFYCSKVRLRFRTVLITETTKLADVRRLNARRPSLQ